MTETTKQLPQVPTENPEPTRRSSLSWRILGWTLLVSSLGIVALLTTTMAAMKHSVEVGSNSEIQQEVNELRTFASTGLDPLTGKPFQDAEAFLNTYMARQQPGRGEIFIGFTEKDGVTGFRLGEDIDIAAGRAMVSSGPVIEALLAQHTGIINTDLGHVRWAKADIVRESSKATFLVLHVDKVRFSDQRRTMAILWPLAGFALLATAVMAWLLSQFIIRPLRELQQNVTEVNDDDLMRRVEVRGHDEVASLATAFNGMLARLEASFQTQRQFLDDAGHELRTPITVVRGHLELIGDDPEERAETITLVLAELDRMNRMVTDLLALAKSEQPDFIRCDAKVDIAQMTLDLDAKVMSIGDRLWTVGQVADGEAIIDEQRVTQAVMQLAQNAVQHTNKGDMITISTTFEKDNDNNEWLCVACADTGEGVADVDKPTLFDRFHRGVNAGADTPGAGLGLSIVRAIAVGHGGTIKVSDTPGGGATFTLRIPRYCMNDHDARCVTPHIAQEKA